MSTISNAQAFCGLTAVATPSKTGVSGSLTISGGTARESLPLVTESYSFAAYIAAGANFALDVLEADFTGTDAWTAGAAQVETATAAGTISTAGNASVTVTATGATWSPKTVSVAVALGDTAAVWAEKVRAALAADADVSSIFTVDGSTTAIRLTRKPLATIDDVNFYADNDSALNIALNNGTCAGITPAASSTNTTAGVLTEGVLLVDGDGNNFQGDAISMIAVQGICFEGFDNSTTFQDASSDAFTILADQKTVHMSPTEALTFFEEISIASATYISKVIITVQGVKTV